MSVEPPFAEALETFYAECQELLQDWEQHLQALMHEDQPGERIHALFRAAHTIKGSAGLFGLEPLVHFTHRLESVLDRIRDAELPWSSSHIPLLLACGDHISACLDLHATGLAVDGGLLEREVQLVAGLEALQGPRTGELATQRLVVPEAASPMMARWHISLRFGQETFRDGMDPLSFLRFLEQMGEIVALVTVTETVPPLGDLDSESCFLGFELAFAGPASKSEIADVFEFVRDSCTLHILPAHDQLGAYMEMLEALPETEQRLGEMLVAVGSLTPEELARALQKQADRGAVGAHAALGRILVAEQMVHAPLVEGALRQQQQRREKQQRDHQMLRIRADALDHVIDLVGELVIASAANQIRAGQASAESRLESAALLNRLVEDIRDGVLGLRMVDVAELFQRFPRVVRDTARQLGKDIRLETAGEGTELDKSLAEKIVDPLMHLVRNAMDHGIESAEQRQSSGKSPQGCIRLVARHESGSIVIEVQDDGGGLNRERILNKALEKGLLAPEQVLSDAEVWALIFAPGFSTAEQVSDLSGRGVGMDVVRRNIEAVRGNIDIESWPGQGSCIRLRLPLTLSIIDGCLVQLGQQPYVIPADSVEECLALASSNGTPGFMDLRGQPLPLLDLARVFGLADTPSDRHNVVVVRHGGERVGLLVANILGNQQTVIKPLGELFAKLPGIAAATILGSGEVAPILDISSMLVDGVSTNHPMSLNRFQEG